MKYHSKNVDSPKNLARLMILNKLYDLVENIYETEFHGLDIRSETAQSFCDPGNLYPEHLTPKFIPPSKERQRYLK